MDEIDQFDINKYGQKAKDIEKEIIGMHLVVTDKDRAEIAQDNMDYLRSLADPEGFETILVYTNKQGITADYWPSRLNVCIDDNTYEILSVNAG